MTNSDSVKLSSNNSLNSLILHLDIKQDLIVYLAEKSTIEFENVYKNFVIPEQIQAHNYEEADMLMGLHS